MTATLTLSDGTTYSGTSFGAEHATSGEVVFNTGMMGYPESFTDPSYYGQILVLTYPLVGSYGVPAREYFESKKMQVRGIIVQNYIEYPSHFGSQQTLADWLRMEAIPAMQHIDTRAVTTKLRYHGVMLGKIAIDKPNNEPLFDPNTKNILPDVSVTEPITYGQGKKHIVLIDCGSKGNILKSLLGRNMRVTVVPHDYNPIAHDIRFDGVLISNGPGDPRMATQTIKTVQNVLEAGIPTFGICLGSQVLALAAGGNTYKLKFGHRGQNQPVFDKRLNKAIISSQNHGFAVTMESLGNDWEEWFINLNDGTNEGLRHKTKPFLAVQFHPEACPGPTDGTYLFDEFLKYL